VPAPANPDVAWAVDDIRANLPRRQRALDYAEGRHPLNFATEKFRNTFGQLFQELSDNLCDDVVNEPTDRLQIEGWGGKYGAEAAAWWEANRGAARSGSVHQNGFRSGDAFVIVWDAGDNVPRLYVQDPRQMAVRYSTTYPDELEVAAKCWREGKGYRLNLYYADRVEHYFSKGVSHQSGEKGIPNATSFLPWTRGQEGDADHVPASEPNDKGRIPVFHFPNGELSQYGASVLADVYPLQDALNKSLCDMLVAGEAYALPHRHATGIQVSKDPVTGLEVSPFKDGQNLWWTANKDAKFGYFPAAELKGFLDQQRAFRLEIARKGGLPAHTVDIGATGNAPSGLSLLIAEGKLIKRCKDRQRDWGTVWRELVAFGLSWLGGTVVAADLDPIWGPVETRDEQALLEGLVIKKALGIPDEQLMLEAGYDVGQIAEFQGKLEEERAKQMDAEAAASGGRISAAGTLAPPPPAPPAGAPQPAGV
jgi:hypothetical protein